MAETEFVLVPKEPTPEMLRAAVRSREGPAVYKVMSDGGLRALENDARDDFRAMIAAAPAQAAPAPQPEAAVVKQSLTTEQPQPVAPRCPGCESARVAVMTCVHCHECGGDFTTKLAQYGRLATPPAAHAVDAHMVERMQAAIEGECDGLAVDESRARAILEYVLAPKEQP